MSTTDIIGWLVGLLIVCVWVVRGGKYGPDALVDWLEYIWRKF